MSSLLKPVCEDCGKEIHGRSDKRFCDDTCRNNFNRKKRQAELIPISDGALEVIRIIKRNYQLLKGKNLGPAEQSFQPLRPLLENGFDPKFFTSMAEEEGQTYRFCFECGFRIIGDLLFVIDRLEQLEPGKI